MLVGDSLFEIIILITTKLKFVYKKNNHLVQVCVSISTKDKLHNANPNLISIKFQTFDPCISFKFDYEFTGGSCMCSKPANIDSNLHKGGKYS
jgi:hypothetical protein